MSEHMLETENIKNAYGRTFLLSNKNSLRAATWEGLLKKGVPTLKTDDWQYTNLKKLLKHDFIYPEYEKINVDLPYEVTQLYSSCLSFYFLNGVLLNDESLRENLPAGVDVEHFAGAGSLSDASMQLREHFSKKSMNVFAELNLALCDRLTRIKVGRDVQVSQPIALINFTTSKTHNPESYNSCVQIICDEGSELDLIETQLSLDENTVFNNLTTEVDIKRNATLNYLKLQNENKNNFQMHQFYSDIDKNAKLNAFNFSTGCELNRNTMQVNIKGENAEAQVNGLYLGAGQQVIDNKTVIEHMVGHTISSQLYKGVLDDASRGVFNGVIKINKDAQKVDSSQMNKNLVLSSKAEADSKPELQVFADDVKANHGSAIGELDVSELFYFQSRGICRRDAIQMLTRGYLKEVAFKVQSLKLQNLVDKVIEQAMQEYFKDLK